LAFQTWTVPQLATVEGLLSQRSDYVFATVGVYGVAESAALYAAQDYASDRPELLLSKQKNAKATCAIARAYPKTNSIEVQKGQ
jgi:cobalt-precorrin 5A hydrolase